MTKQESYRILVEGGFGNTIPQFFSVEEWLACADSDLYQFWGVRSTTTPGHPACRLYCPRKEVPDAAAKLPGGVNISMMVDAIAEVTAWLEVWDSPTGLVVEGIEHPRIHQGWNWRNSMQKPERRRSWHLSEAMAVLKRHLNPNSLEDLFILLDQYPDHVVELTALGSCLGTVPHRNGIIWEVRNY